MAETLFSVTKPWALRLAKLLTLVFAVSVLGYLVYCAHRSARADSGATPEVKTNVINVTKGTKTSRVKKKPKHIFIHSSKSGRIRILRKKQTDAKKKGDQKKDQKKAKKKKKLIFLPSSKAGNFTPFEPAPKKLKQEDPKKN